MLKLVVRGQEVVLTEEHPFFTFRQGWTPAHLLVPGDLILGLENDWVEVEAVENTGRYEIVYNMTVRDSHTFFVGKPEWNFALWVHNAGPCPLGGAAPKGGPYDKVRAGNTGGQVHHTPAAKITPFEYRKAPSVWMETADHRLTKSWGSSADAKAYRQIQDDLINQGKLREAIQMDIDDIRAKFGNKYDENIRQMLQSFGFSQ